MKSMKEYFEKGYEVVVEGMFGDIPVMDMEDVETYEDDSQFVRVDEEKKVAYFEEVDYGQYDE